MSSLLAACQAPNLSLNRSTPAKLVVAPLREPVEAIPPNLIVEVRANDTLYAVATRYQVTPQSVIEANGLQPPYNLRKGQALKLVPRRTHIVRPGDSVYVISQRYAVSQYQLAQLNYLKPPFELKIGQKLQLPNSLDFSVLDVGLPDGVSSTNIAQPTPTENSVPAAPRKRFVAPSLASSSGFTWPVQGEIITEFGPSQRGVHNDGVNIAASEGASVGAAAKGRVAFVGTNIKSFGKLVLVKHDGGIITAYAHLGDISVKEGDIVTAGQSIGTIGRSGRVDSPQLHFEIRKSRQPVDPRSLIS
ncbi:MAG: M23 family metallopeptidase [Proteobacteria bacterium]|nr:M23 family metallopeptidase [Pseudomonadota bacterium]MDA0883906.1 M23 family metallopeptidase [Pseudomonadota bacterium]MDA1149694.1 M23 family metallopeptidase [Pseudomonadota bacterium]